VGRTAVERIFDLRGRLVGGKEAERDRNAEDTGDGRVRDVDAEDDGEGGRVDVEEHDAELCKRKGKRRFGYDARVLERVVSVLHLLYRTGRDGRRPACLVEEKDTGHAHIRRTAAG
jgi:hypothetical protein